MSLEWALEFQIETSGETERCEITVSPTGQEISLYKYDDGNLPKYTDFAIGGKKGAMEMTSLFSRDRQAPQLLCRTNGRQSAGATNRAVRTWFDY